MRPHEIVVFLGPSLPVADARRVLDARYLGPARCGDVLRVRRLKPRVIGIVDGLFETTAAPWHKEILLALEDGIAVYGAASMGALRAAELAPFGMVGVGRIFEAYRDGVYVDDDEVAVLHGDARVEYRVLSDAMVNIRATVARAVECGVIATGDAGRLLDGARATFYQERSLTAAIKLAWPDPCAARERFEGFLEHGGYVDQRRLDALALLHRFATLTPPRRVTPLGTRVERTTFLARLQRDVACRPFIDVGAHLPVERHRAG